VVFILPPRCWQQQIDWSYCNASRTFGLLAWRNWNKKDNLAHERRVARSNYAARLVCHCFSVRLSPWWLTFSFTFFKNLGLALGFTVRVTVRVSVKFSIRFSATFSVRFGVRQARNQGGRGGSPPRKLFAPPGKMCWL